jgi:hypothetical protein
MARSESSAIQNEGAKEWALAVTETLLRKLTLSTSFLKCQIDKKQLSTVYSLSDDLYVHFRK